MRRWAGIVLVLTVGAVAAAGCGGQTKTVTVTSAVTSTAAQASTTQPTSAPATTASGGGLRAWRTPSPSMVPTLAVGTTVLTNSSQTPSLGQIIVFHPPAGADPITPQCGNSSQGAGHSAACDEPTPQASPQTFIKRVVGLPGDQLKIVNGTVYRNGAVEPAPYTEPCGSDPSCNFPQTITIPSGDYFVLGDNRGASDDSRFWGPVPQADIIGVVVSCQPSNKYCTGP